MSNRGLRRPSLLQTLIEDPRGALISQNQMLDKLLRVPLSGVAEGMELRAGGIHAAKRLGISLLDRT